MQYISRGTLHLVATGLWVGWYHSTTMKKSLGGLPWSDEPSIDKDDEEAFANLLRILEKRRGQSSSSSSELQVQE